ncbi:carbamoyltransferase N-terminal domain-containing protein [Dactylosporangium sp. NPDC048998]|uniref:carbamoyltransferase N-terminal domain-containing protein n=1 Tax=Dactylosporangium sp. NPDC048998 TaxID=3363976 RepID=UPI003721E1B0
MWVLGINWEWHDSAAALVDGDGNLVACVEEERFTRVKHAWNTFPRQSTAYCLATAGISWRDVDVVAVGWDMPRNRRWYYPARDRRRLLEAIFGEPVGPGAKPEVVFVDHHLAHASSSFHASGFEEAGVLVVDGSGEFYSTSIYSMSRSTGHRPLRHWPRGFSLGTMYEAATRAIGFGELEAGKTMGLASYGGSVPSEVLPLGDVIAQDRPYFDLHDAARYQTFVEAWMEYLAKTYEPVTRGHDELHLDPVAVAIAAGVQRTVEEALRALHTETVCLSGQSQVCLAGGVALNCVANGRLPEPIYIPPFPHDSGVAIGAAWTVNPPKHPQLLASPYTGTMLQPKSAAELRDSGLEVTEYTPEAVIDLLLQQQIGAVAEGRAEIGPRALGHRSIVALPSQERQRDIINARKGREPWRPLAPVTLPSYAPMLWPTQGNRERYMVGNTVVSSHGREVMPATVHVDGTTRPQVLQPGSAPALEGLLAGMEAAGIPPVLVNTSLNMRGKPIADTADDVLETFHDVGLDFVVLGDALIRRAPGGADR